MITSNSIDISISKPWTDHQTAYNNNNSNWMNSQYGSDYDARNAFDPGNFFVFQHLLSLYSTVNMIFF